MRLVFGIAALSVFISGCSTTYTIPDHNLRDGPYMTSSTVKPASILTKKRYDRLDNVGFAVIKIESGFKPQEQSEYLEHVLNELGINEVLTEDEWVAKIISESLDSEVSTPTDLLSLKKLSDSLGDFLVIEWTTDVMGGAKWKNVLTVVDPTVPEKILEVRESKTLWANINTELAYPVMNLLREVLLGDFSEGEGSSRTKAPSTGTGASNNALVHLGSSAQLNGRADVPTLTAIW